MFLCFVYALRVVVVDFARAIICLAHHFIPSRSSHFDELPIGICSAFSIYLPVTRAPSHIPCFVCRHGIASLHRPLQDLPARSREED
jgi:hypothetical protein